MQTLGIFDEIEALVSDNLQVATLSLYRTASNLIRFYGSYLSNFEIVFWILFLRFIWLYRTFFYFFHLCCLYLCDLMLVIEKGFEIMNASLLFFDDFRLDDRSFHLEESRSRVDCDTWLADKNRILNLEKTVGLIVCSTVLPEYSYTTGPC